MLPNEKFGSGSLAAAGTAVFLAITLQPVLGYVALRAGDTAAWITPVIAGTLSLLLYWPVAAGLAVLPGGGNLIALARAAAGEPAGVITGVLVSGVLVYDSGLVLRRLAEATVSLLYPHTPQTVAIVALSLAALYGAYGGPSDVVRMCRLLTPLFVLSLCVILIGPLPWSDPQNLLPWLGPGIVPLVGKSVGLMGLYGPPILFLLVAAGDLSDRQRLWRAGLVATGGATSLFIAFLAVILLTYPLPLGYSIVFPLQELTRLVVGGRFFERTESLWILFGFFGAASYLAAVLHTAAAAYAGAFRMTTHRPAVLPIVTIAIVVSLFPTDQGEALTMRVASIPVVGCVAFVLPLVLALLAAWRRRSQEDAQ